MTPTPSGSVAAWLTSEAVRFGVPFVVAALIGYAAKAGLKIAPDVAFTYVSGAVGAGLSALMKLLEAKFSWAKRILLAKKPAALS